MAPEPDHAVSRREMARLCAAALAAGKTSANSHTAHVGSASTSEAIDVTCKPFCAIGDGVTDDAPAIRRAVASLPASGGIIRLPGPRIYVLRSTIDDGGKPIQFQIGHAQVLGPTDGPIFALTRNGSGIVGAGAGATVLRLPPPDRRPIPPLYRLVLANGEVASADVLQPGANLVTTPLLDVEESPAGNGAAIVASVSGGRITRSDLVAAGSGYATAPAVTMRGGGQCAIQIQEANHCSLADFTIDLMSVPHAVGIFHNGGWYADLRRVDISEATLDSSAIALVVDSHTLGRPGRNGSYGGAYLGHYAQVIAKRTFLVGHDTSTISTLHFDTLDAAHLHIHGAIAITLTNAVFQGDAECFLDLVNVDGLSMVGGDIEGGSTLIRTRGACNNIRLAPLAYSATGQVLQGQIGSGWRLDLAKSNAAGEILHSGNTGSATLAYQNAGWIEKHRSGIQYSGDSIVYSSNIRLIGPYRGFLDNPVNPGFAMIMTISGQLILRKAEPGTGCVILKDLAMFDDGGLEIRNLPSTRPHVGANRLWFDPADGFRVKFQP